MASKAKAVKASAPAKAEIGEKQIKEMRRFWDGGERLHVMKVVKAADPAPAERERLYREFPGLDALLARS